MADVLANHYKRLRIRAIRGILAVALCGFFLFQIYLEFSDTFEPAHEIVFSPELEVSHDSGPFNRAFLLVAYPAFLAVGIFWYWIAKRREFERKHEDYRALAEAMRVQIFWRLSGVNRNVADHYLDKYEGELAWVRYALRTWKINVTGAEKISEGHELARRHWIADQERWFAFSATRDSMKLERIHNLSAGLFVSGVILAFALFVMHFTTFKDHIKFEQIIHPMIIIFCVTYLATAAALQGYVEKLALSEQAKQFGRMNQVFAIAHKKVKDFIAEMNRNDTETVLFELGKEALIENGDWLLLHRSRPLEIPIMETNPRI